MTPQEQEGFIPELESIRDPEDTNPMTPDLQARIEAAARELADSLPINRNHRETAREDISAALATLAKQIIAERDAEAAGMREAIRLRLQSVSLVLREGRQRQPGNQYISDAVWHGWIHERKVLDELLEIELPPTGRDLLAEVINLRALLAWYEKPDHPIGSLAEKDHKFRDKIKQLSLTTTEPSR